MRYNYLHPICIYKYRSALTNQFHFHQQTKELCRIIIAITAALLWDYRDDFLKVSDLGLNSLLQRDFRQPRWKIIGWHLIVSIGGGLRHDESAIKLI